ncbi:DUF4180 domain-containing protein [Terrisporobacter glycolicus]|uniref:DUF4180 domain-containing protein n=1 Tax=Terrisporobacter glycolicus ATCC 14880 = DSM 1288 TaxID=1121315 RepID=A0ABZ2ETA7_9FIRM|nr:DUF4180 domain-containing protein [Terrisporobacter glycolicus]
MNYKIIDKTNKKYIEVKQSITCESDVLDIIDICISNDIRLLLKLGLAGIALQKFINYNIKVSGIIEDKKKIDGRFGELIYELNRSNNFRVFSDTEDAEKWILNIKY